MAQPRNKKSDAPKDADAVKESKATPKLKKLSLEGQPGLHQDTSPTEIGERVMDTYFQYKEIGRVKGILKNKYNLFSA